MNILIHGAAGRMGHAVAALALAGAHGVTGAIGVDARGECAGIACVRSLDEVRDAPDCIVDFSNPAALDGLLHYALAERVPVVIATTGFSESELQRIAAAANEIPVFRSANMSLGVALLTELVKQAARTMAGEIEIVEAHHDRKLDAPSGTAKLLVQAVQSVRPVAYPVYGRSGMGKRTPDEIGVHAIRMGSIVGMHEVMIGTDSETITIKHEAHDRSLFADGALAAAAFLIRQPAGLYDMSDLVKNSQ